MTKHIFRLFSILCICFVLTVVAAAVAPIGDVNDDGKFSAIDVLRILKACTEDVLTDADVACMDVDGDGAVMVSDVLLMLRYCVKEEKPSFCAVNNIYHKGCVWNYLEIGDYDVLTFSTNKYPEIEMNFKIYIPASYSPHKSYALATHLHGLGGESKAPTQLSGSTYFNNILSGEYAEDTILLLPQCPEGMTWPSDRDTIEVAYMLIQDLVNHMSIDKNRLYLSGHSNGSKGVAYMINSHPNTFAAAVMGSGASPLANYTIENLATTPIWMFCGDADTTADFLKNVRALYAALTEINAEVKYTEFEGLGHNIFSTVGNQEGLVDWVFSHTLTE